MRHPNLIQASDKAQAAACRIAAETAMLNPYETLIERERRRDYMLAEAERFDRLQNPQPERIEP